MKVCAAVHQQWGVALAEQRVHTGIVVGYRRGSNTQYENQVLIRVDGVTKRDEAARLIGWRVVYRDNKGNTYNGRIVGVHGSKGIVIARFNRNLPGQSIGDNVYMHPRGVRLVFS